MICFEITINGNYVCTAGIGELGVLHTIVTWVKTSKVAPASGETVSRDNLDIHVGGLAHPDADTSQHVDWLNQAISVGDEITIRVIESPIYDEPTRDKPRFEGCSFCGKKPLEEGKLIAGSQAFICLECVLSYTKAMNDGKTDELSANQLQNARCSFCGRASSEVARMIDGLTATICNGCVGMCNFILGKFIPSGGKPKDI